jgi:hypothetical protein
MSNMTVAIRQAALRKLQELAQWSGLSIDDALEKAINDQYDRQFWDAVNAGYAALRADPEVWAAVEAERRAWDATLMDGLDPTENWADDGTPLPPTDREQAS